MSEDIKNAFKAIAKRTVRVEVNADVEVYVKPVDYGTFISALGDYEGAKDKKEASKLFDATIDACSLCDKDGKTVFTPEEYLEFWDTLPMEVGLAITKAKRALNDFNELDASAKKK